MKKVRKNIVLALFSALALQTGYALTADKIVAFGDSISDNGNIFSLTSTAHKVIPQVPILPKDPPYYQGRFSNGPVWIENLAAIMQLPLEDYAYGGAWAESVLDSKQVVPFGLGMQVSLYLAKAVVDFHKDKHLYVIWVGGNDYTGGRDDSQYATSNVIATIQTQIESLIWYGATKFLIMNLPDLGFTPEVMEQGPEFSASISKLSELHNAKLADMVSKEKKDHPNVEFVAVDVSSYFADAISNPAKYELKNVTQACFGGGYTLMAKFAKTAEINAAKKANMDILKNASLKTAYLTAALAAAGEQPCANPNEYLYWDHIHPTGIVHQRIASLVFDALSKEG